MSTLGRIISTIVVLLDLAFVAWILCYYTN